MSKTTIAAIFEQVITGRETQALIRGLFKAEIKPDAYYCYDELQQLLRVSYQTLHRAVLKGGLKVSYVGGEPRLRGADIHAWIKAGGKTGRTAADVDSDKARAASRA